MKYTVETTIDLPRDEVIRKLDNVENLKHWQKGLVGVEHVSGTPGQVGAKMKINYRFGKKEFSLLETITKRNMPEEFHAIYEAGTMRRIQTNQFRDAYYDVLNARRI